jgi:hypothetical protein
VGPAAPVMARWSFTGYGMVLPPDGTISPLADRPPNLRRLPSSHRNGLAMTVRQHSGRVCSASAAALQSERRRVTALADQLAKKCGKTAVNPQDTSRYRAGGIERSRR